MFAIMFMIALNPCSGTFEQAEDPMNVHRPFVVARVTAGIVQSINRST